MCPLRVRVSWPVAASQTFTVPSTLAEAIRLPSGLNATLLTPSVCPLRVRISSPGRGVPDLHRPIHTGGGDPPAVGAECQHNGGGEPLAVRAVRHALGMPLEGEDFLPGPGVPDLHRLVLTGGGDPPAVRAERHAPDTDRYAP